MEKPIGVKPKKWEIVEDKNIADVFLVVFGKTKHALLNNLLEAFAAIITEIKEINNLKEKITFKVEAFDFSEQIFLFIEKLIYLKDTKHLIFKKGDFCFKKNSIEATLFGQKLTHLPIKVDIKALTRHKFDLKRKNGIYRLSLVFDI
jgi:SHS2 domain-containing protein